MDLNDLNRVLKYSRLRTQEEWLPFVQQYLDSYDVNRGKSDHNVPLIMADFLQDEGDPRAEVLRRGADDTAVAGRIPTDRKGYRETDQHQVNGPFGGIGFSIYDAYVKSKVPSRKLVIGLEFPNEQGRGIHRYVEATPEEAHAIVEHLPDEHKDAARAFLNDKFGERT